MINSIKSKNQNLQMTWCLKCYLQEYFISSGGNVFIQWHKRLAKSLFMGAIKMLRFHSSQLGRSSRYSHRTEPAGGYYTETDIYMQNKPEKKNRYTLTAWIFISPTPKACTRKVQYYFDGYWNACYMYSFFSSVSNDTEFFCFLIKFVTFKRRHLYL